MGRRNRRKQILFFSPTTASTIQLGCVFPTSGSSDRAAGLLSVVLTQNVKFPGHEGLVFGSCFGPQARLPHVFVQGVCCRTPPLEVGPDLCSPRRAACRPELGDPFLTHTKGMCRAVGGPGEREESRCRSVLG